MQAYVFSNAVACFERPHHVFQVITVGPIMRSPKGSLPLLQQTSVSGGHFFSFLFFLLNFPFFRGSVRTPVFPVSFIFFFFFTFFFHSRTLLPASTRPNPFVPDFVIKDNCSDNSTRWINGASPNHPFTYDLMKTDCNFFFFTFIFQRRYPRFIVFHLTKVCNI